MPLHIPHPCSENWDTMSPTEQGKFCTACQKEVVDFTTFSLPAIKQFLEQHTEESLCGNFYEDQLEAFNQQYQVQVTPSTLVQVTPSIIVFLTPSRIRQWAAAAILTAVTTLPSFGQDPLTIDTLPSLHTAVVVDNAQKTPTVTLSGRIWDPVQKAAVPMAILQVKGSHLDGITGTAGNFSLTVPLTQEPITLVVNHHTYGTTYHEIVPNQSRTGLVLEIKPIVKESTSVTSEKEIKKIKKPRRRRRRGGRVLMGCPVF